MSLPPHDLPPSQDDQTERPVPHEEQVEDFENEAEDGRLAAARLTGQTIGDYRVEERLGGGAHSTVYRAVDLETGAVIALKLLLPGADGVARARFRHEARTATSLDHPHIVKTLSIGQVADDDVAYIAMELVEGLSLATLLDRYRQLSVLDACTVLGPIAAALAYAHRRGIVHRDVKPSNILLRRVEAGTPGSVKLSMLDYPVVPLLTDFGIARALDAPELTNVGRTIGTPAYMAPEQCEGGRKIDGRADIYSLGTVLYRALVGRPPFTGTTTQILYAHVYHSLTIPDAVLIELPVHVINILRRSLAKEPQDRYGSADEMAADLAQISGRYAAMSQVTGVSPDEATRTMSSLPTTRPRTDSYSVLVPAVARQGADNQPTRTSRTLEAVPPRPSARRLSMPLLAIGLVAAAMLVVIGFGLALRSGPAADPAEPPVAGATATPAAVAGVELTPDATAPAAEPSDRPTTAVDANGPTPEPRPNPPVPAVEIPSAWRDAVGLRGERDWQLTHDQLTFLLRADPDFNALAPGSPDEEAALIRTLLLDNPSRPFWADAAETFSPDELADMLFDVYVGMGTQMNRQSLSSEAAAYYRAALVIDPNNPELADLLQGTLGYQNALPGNRVAAKENLQQLHIAYADGLEGAGQACAALEQIDVANTLDSTPALVARLTALENRCANELVIVEGEVPLDRLSGTLIYGSRQDGNDRIFALDVERVDEGAVTPTLLAEDAILGAPSPTTERMAFYSTRSNGQGLFGIDIGQAPTSRIIRFTRFAEDGAESPASWDARGERLVFASRREGDRQSRIYVTWADGEDDSTTIANGGDPAWHPAFESIVYSGVDQTGNRPGLWLVDSAGGNPDRLTTVETDRRPQWSPGGQYIVFTSLERDGNWEIYRYDTVERALTRMTDDPAQDVVPTVSPDGQLLAFLSDRNGVWAIWVMPLAGGEPVVLAPIVGDIAAWEKASIDWVP
jgi:serine/threonine protein kinase